MVTSAEQIYHRRFEQEGESGVGQRMYVDLDICHGAECRSCTVECSYFYHPANNGMLSIAELASYALVCRRCEDPHCVAACPVDALEQQTELDRMLIRHTMRCVSCGSCAHACPYGTVYPENVPLLIHVCDYCFDRRTHADEPRCVSTCPYDALRVHDAGASATEDEFLVGAHLVVHSTHWQHEKA